MSVVDTLAGFVSILSEPESLYTMIATNDKSKVIVAPLRPPSGTFSVVAVNSTSLNIVDHISIDVDPLSARIEPTTVRFGAVVMDQLAERLVMSPQADPAFSTVYITGFVDNALVIRKIIPANFGSLYVDGGLSLSEFGVMYVNEIAPVGGNPFSSVALAQDRSVLMENLRVSSMEGALSFGADDPLGSSVSIFVSTTVLDNFTQVTGSALFAGTLFTVSTTTILNGSTTVNGSMDFNATVTMNTILFDILGTSVTLDAASFFLCGADTARFTGANAVETTPGIQGFGGTFLLLPLGAQTPEDLEVTLAASVAGGDPADRGIVLKSNDNTRFRLTVSNAGALRIDAV